MTDPAPDSIFVALKPGIEYVMVYRNERLYAIYAEVCTYGYWHRVKVWPVERLPMIDHTTETQNLYAASRYATVYHWRQVLAMRRTGNTHTPKYRMALDEYHWWRTECKRLEELMRDEVRR